MLHDLLMALHGLPGGFFDFKEDGVTFSFGFLEFFFSKNAQSKNNIQVEVLNTLFQAKVKIIVLCICCKWGN